MNLRAARLLLSGLLLLLSWGCAAQHRLPADAAPDARSVSDAMTKPPVLYAPASQGLEPVPYEALPALAQGVDYILIGEGHTVACDHLAQAAVIDALVKAGRRPALALEMVGEDLQPVLDKFNADHSLSATAFSRRLERELDWPRLWGHPYTLYAPVFIRAYAAGLPFYGVNAPPGVVRKYSRGGNKALSEAERAYLPDPVILPGEEQRTALAKEFVQHSAMLARMRAKKKQSMPSVRPIRSNPLEHFLKIQSLWDTKMAQGLVDVRRRTGAQVVLLAGSGHVENGWGVARRLRLLDPGARILLVAPWRGGPFPKPGFADLVFQCAESHGSRYGFTFSWNSEPKGALITGIKPGSVADKAGFRKQDLVVEMLGEPVKSMTDLHSAAMRARKNDQPLLFTVLRDGKRIPIELPIWRIKVRTKQETKD